MRTRFLGFVDDVVIRVEADGDETRVDMRSKSREGLVDGGSERQARSGFFRTFGRNVSFGRCIEQMTQPGSWTVPVWA